MPQVNLGLKEGVKSVQINNTETAEKIYQKIQSEFEKISEQNLDLLLDVQVLFHLPEKKMSSFYC